MCDVYKDEMMNYDGKSYYKSTSGLWMETNYKREDNMPSVERNIKNFAKKISKQIRKPTSTIKIPFEKEIQYEVEKNIEVTEGFLFFKSTRTEKVMEQQTGTNVDYEDVRIDGWILKTYYENVDTVVNGECLEQEVAKWFYVLKKDGSLSVFQLGYVIRHPKTNWEGVRIFQALLEQPMTFFDGTSLGSAYLLDFKQIKWEHSCKKRYNEICYFRRNYPTRIGKYEYKGESYLIQEAGTGIMEALKKLEKGRVKK